MTTKYDPSTAKLYYLKKDCSRYVMMDKDSNRERLPVSFDGVKVRMVAVKFWESVGNFACPYVHKGRKLIAVFPDNEVNHTMWVPYDVKYPNKN